MLKPAEATPLSALRLGELALPRPACQGVVNVSTATARPSGQRLAQHPLVDKISFTGSTATGTTILRRPGNLKRVTLELGGKSANIIFPDADIAAAAASASAGIFFNAGQACCARSRILVHDRRTTSSSVVSRPR